MISKMDFEFVIEELQRHKGELDLPELYENMGYCLRHFYYLLEILQQEGKIEIIKTNGCEYRYVVRVK